MNDNLHKRLDGYTQLHKKVIPINTQYTDNDKTQKNKEKSQVVELVAILKSKKVTTIQNVYKTHHLVNWAQIHF